MIKQKQKSTKVLQRMVEQKNFGVMHRACSHNIRKKLALLVTQQNYGNVWRKVERDGNV